ncbi:MAG: tetratricopeptide repeat protein [PVC group bacterium]|nr:tetratricopeptide repeat protein [PVC group bacterium]
MKWFNNLMFLICIGMMFLYYPVQINAAETASIDNSFRQELNTKINNFFQEKQFVEAIEYLEALNAEKVAEENADSLYIEYYLMLTKTTYLDYLESEEDWENYYNSYQDLDIEIIETAEYLVSEYSVSGVIVDVQSLAWKAYMREEDKEAADGAFDALVDMVIAYTAEQGDIVKFKELADLVNSQAGYSQMNTLFAEYRDYLIETEADISSVDSLSEVARSYLETEDIDTAIIIYEHYMELLAEHYDTNESLEKLSMIADKFRHHGFSPAQDADFAETVYDYVQQKFGLEALSDMDMLARAYNLELNGQYERAFEEYKNFVKMFPDSQFIHEAYTRLGVISFYCLSKPEQGIAFFQKVLEDAGNSFNAPFCMYEMALFYQWNQEHDMARELYLQLSEGEGMFADLAAQRLAEIDEGDQMQSDLTSLFDLVLKEKTEDSTIIMELTAQPDRGIVGEEIILTGVAQDFSAGTVQPSFSYEWLRDTGTSGDPGNVTEFKTTYDTPGPKIVCFSAEVADSRAVIGKVIWIYELAVSMPETEEVKTGESVDFKAQISPPITEEDYLKWAWTLSGPEEVSGEGKEFSAVFAESGSYEGQLEISNGEIKAVKKFTFQVTE